MPPMSPPQPFHTTAVPLARRSAPFGGTTMAATWLCTTLIGVASSACGNSKKAPVAQWAHDQATWDMAKWQDACSPGAAARVDANSIAWSRIRLDTRQNDGRLAAMVTCDVAFDAGQPLSLTISVKALPEEIPALLERPLDAMLTEVPPAVAAAAKELAARGRRGGRYVGAFTVATYLRDSDNAFSQSVDGRWAVEFAVWITPRWTM